MNKQFGDMMGRIYINTVDFVSGSQVSDRSMNTDRGSFRIQPAVMPAEARDTIRLHESAPQLLALARKITQKCYDPTSRREIGSDGKLCGLVLTLEDVIEAANAIHAATGVVVGIPDTLPDREED